MRHFQTKHVDWQKKGKTKSIRACYWTSDFLEELEKCSEVDGVKAIVKEINFLSSFNGVSEIEEIGKNSHRTIK